MDYVLFFPQSILNAFPRKTNIPKREWNSIGVVSRVRFPERNETWFLYDHEKRVYPQNNLYYAYVLPQGDFVVADEAEYSETGAVIDTEYIPHQLTLYDVIKHDQCVKAKGY
ncbi:MAG: hypothetical protein HPY53_01640 [Brevinematales bacterium]|nr:hypothetical protein [Brevinematales bacterium]